MKDKAQGSTPEMPPPRPAVNQARRNPSSVKDRLLGDEWIDWNGDPSLESAAVDADERVFVGFAFLSLLVLILLGLFVFYMISPRLEGWHHSLAQAMMFLFVGASAALVLWFVTISLPLLTGWRMPLRLEAVRKVLHFFIPLAVSLGKKFGVSRDRMSNSFIKVSNLLVRTARINTDMGPLLVLLPRCLTGRIRQDIQSMCDRYRCKAYVVPGGEQARRLIHQHRPSRIIAIACERDLMSGIQDVATVIPTYAIPNCRPEGPCKNTVVDLKRIEEALILFTPRNP